MVKESVKLDDDHPNFQNDITLKSTRLLFMHYQSNIIIGLYSYLQEYSNKDIDVLFSDAINLFNALGSWIYGGTSPKIIYPELQVFIKKANCCTSESFSQLLNYINWLGKNLYKILEDNQWIEEHYYESFTIRKSDDITTGLFFMWRLGWLNVRIKDISKESTIPNILQLLKTLDALFDSFGGWIYHQEEIFSITQSLNKFTKLFGSEFDPLFDEILEEAKTTSKNISRFLQKL